jgi:hypothetical protein
MADRTESGFSRSGLFSILYCTPGLYALARFVTRPPSREDAPIILSVCFVGLAVLILVCTTLLPALLQRLGQPERAALWRRAAISGISFSVVWTFVWTMLHMPLGAVTVRLAVAAAGCAVALAGLWWVDRRWWHLDLFKRER